MSLYLSSLLTALSFIANNDTLTMSLSVYIIVYRAYIAGPIGNMSKEFDIIALDV